MRKAVVATVAAVSLLAGLAGGVLLLGGVPFGGPHRTATIYMTRPISADPNLVADCDAYVDADRLRVRRGHQIEWRIEDDPELPCDGLDERRVDVRLKTTGMGPSDGTATAPYIKVLPATGVLRVRIRGRISKNGTEAPDGLHGYVIFYMNMQASPDPEYDVDGDCTNCP